MQRKYNDLQESEICDEYKKGFTLKQCAIKRLTNETLISRILKRNGIKTRLNRQTGKAGKYCSRYGGGRWLNKKGYVCITVPIGYKWGHKGYWIQEHRYVMQNKIKRKLKPIEHIHHINGIKTDNRIENLLIIKAGQHSRLHNSLRSKNDIRTGFKRND